MERSYDDRDRRVRGYDDRMSHGRIRYDQHEQEHWRDRESDRYLHEHRNQERRPQLRYDERGGPGQFDQRDHREPALRGRYQYGPEEDPHLWDERWRSGGVRDDSHISGPRRAEPWRSPGHQDDYGKLRAGDAGYDPWHGHNDSGAMGSARGYSWERVGDADRSGGREERRESGNWRQQRYDDHDRGPRGWQERVGPPRERRTRHDEDSWRRERLEGGAHRDYREEMPREWVRPRDDERRAQEGGEHEGRFQEDRGESGRDIAGTWRQFEDHSETGEW